MSRRPHRLPECRFVTFSDARDSLLDLVAEGDKVVACQTHLGPLVRILDWRECSIGKPDFVVSFELTEIVRSQF
jgi:hypothetical protein